MITISHKIENSYRTTSRRATSARHSVAPVLLIIGGLQWQRRYKEGDESEECLWVEESVQCYQEREFPFVVEVTKYATQQPFINLGKAFKKFFEDLKKGIVSYPQFKKRITKVVSILAVSFTGFIIWYQPQLGRKNFKDTAQRKTEASVS